MSSFTRWLKRLIKRRFAYQASVLCGLLACLYLLFAVIVPSVGSVWRELGARTPLGASQLVPVRVSLSQLTPQQRELIKREPNAVPVHQVRPQLALVGLGREVNERGEELTLGLLPKDAERVLKDDTVMSVRVEAPSLSLLMDDLMSSPRGQALKSSAQARQDKLMSSWSDLLPSLQNSLSKYFKPEELTKLMSDEVIITRLKGALQREIIERVNVEELKAGLGESEALSNLGELAFKHVQGWQITRELFGGAWGGAKEGANQLKDQAKTLWEQDTFGFDSAMCALQVVSVVGPLPRFMERFTQGSSKLCESAKSAGKTALVQGAKRGGVDLLSQASQSLWTERDQATEESKALFDQAIKLSKAPVLLKGFWGQLSHDQELIDHIKKEYGEETLSRFSLALREIATSEAFNGKLNELQREVTSLGREAFKAIALDREGKGPNPLLLAVIQEQLSGQLRPVVHVTPGKGAAVKPNYLFPSQAEVSR